MKKAKLYYSDKPRELLASAYKSQIYSDIWEKISEGFECKTIAEFYKECSKQELAEVTNWTHTVFGKELCDSVDQAIDLALIEEETEMSNVDWIEIYESICTPEEYTVVLFLEDPEHKQTKIRNAMRKNLFY